LVNMEDLGTRRLKVNPDLVAGTFFCGRRRHQPGDDVSPEDAAGPGRVRQSRVTTKLGNVP